MAQREIEIILLRQWASHMSLPIWVAGLNGDLLYYNEPAEALLGHRYEETGQLPLEEWGPLWKPTDADGHPLAAEDLPLAVAVRDRKPAQGSFSIRGSDGVQRQLTITAIPLEGADGAHLGAFAIFWES